MPTVSAHVAAALSQHADHVFGLMGNGNAYFLDALLRAGGLEFTAMRHEAGTVFAADAHYRAGGGLAIATTTYGPGFTNTLTALAEAAQARVPLVLVVGDEPTSGPRPWAVDQIALASGVGVRTYTVGVPDAAATAAIAVQHALDYRRPVVLAVPYDVAKADAGPLPENLSAAERATSAAPGLPPFTDAVLQQAAEALAGAERPFLLAGRGAWLSQASGALGELAEATQALTASSALGRGIFPAQQFDLGVAGGFGAPAAMQAVRTADVAVVIGASLNQFTMRFGDLFGPGTTVIQIDTAPTATHPNVGLYVRGDAAEVTAELARRVSALRSPGSDGGWRASVDVPALRAQEVGGEYASDGRLDPRAVAQRIGELLPADRVVVSDGGHFIGWANMFWPVAAPDRMMMVGTAYQTIGTGWPSMPGAAAAKPDSAVVLSTGDGGGLMALADLDSAVRACGGRGLAVVWNDAAYGAEVNLYGILGLEQEPMIIEQTDFAGYTDAAGGRGVVVRSLRDLDALREWAEQPADQRPFLTLDVRVSTSVIAPYQEEIIALNR